MNLEAQNPESSVASAGGVEASDVTIIVCGTCRDESGSDAHPRAGVQLWENAQFAARDTGISVQTVECLGNCKRRLSAAIVSPGRWTYVFGDLVVFSGSDLVAGAQLLNSSSDGLMPWRGRPDCLKRGLVARIPPLPLSRTTS